MTPPPPTLTLAHLDPDAIGAEMLARGWKTGRSLRLLRAMYAGREIDPLAFGEPVAAWAGSIPHSPTTVVSSHTASDGTTKLLLNCHDGEAGTVECVLMPTERPGETSACLSSQIGCAMGCDFCASTLAGVKRSLTSAEIVGQFLHLRRVARERGTPLTSLVFMGMGEPMLNLEAVIPAIRRIAHHDCGGLGFKNVQVSTVGIVPGIEAFTASGLRVTLALSLHGPDDETRSRIVPAGRKYTVAATLDAAYAHQLATGRVANIEYCLLAGVNDSTAHAEKLADALAGRRMHVNLIPFNPIGAGLSGVTYRRPTPEAVAAFLKVLRDRRVAAHVRVTRGDDASAACGQLRRQTLPVLAG